MADGAFASATVQSATGDATGFPAPQVAIGARELDAARALIVAVVRLLPGGVDARVGGNAARDHAGTQWFSRSCGPATARTGYRRVLLAPCTLDSN